MQILNCFRRPAAIVQDIALLKNANSLAELAIKFVRYAYIFFPGLIRHF